MARLDPLPMEQLTPEQKALHAALIGTRKSSSADRSGSGCENPAIADAADRLVKALRENGKLEAAVRADRADRRAALVGSLRLGRDEAPAGAAGLPPETIEAIRHQRSRT